MFNLFTSKETKLKKAMQQIFDEIIEAGGALEVCKKFGDWFTNNELREIIGLVSEKQSPFDKLTIMYASLLLLDEARKNKHVKDFDISLISTYAENAYIASALLVEDDVLIPLLKEIQLTSVIPKEKIEPYYELFEKHKEAWNKFIESDIDLKSFVLSMNKSER
jgi:hypothetical protein